MACKPLFEVGADFQPAGGDEVADAGYALLFAVGLRGAAGGAAYLPDGFAPEPVALGAADGRMRRQVLAQSVVVVDGGGHIIQHGPVSAPHQNADFGNPGEFVGHCGEAGHKKVTHGNVSRLGLSEDSLEIFGKCRNAGRVDDIHIRPLAGSPERRCAAVKGTLRAGRGRCDRVGGDCLLSWHNDSPFLLSLLAELESGHSWFSLAAVAVGIADRGYDSRSNNGFVHRNGEGSSHSPARVAGRQVA